MTVLCASNEHPAPSHVADEDGVTLRQRPRHLSTLLAHVSPKRSYKPRY